MAVEARHLNLFPPQLIGNREIMNPIETNANIFNNAHHHHHHHQNNIGVYGLPPPGVITAETLLPSYNSPINDPPKTARKSSDSGLTYTVNPTPYSRKRSRENSVNPLLSYPIGAAQAMNKNCSSASPFSFLGEDISLHIQQQQFDVDRLVSQHMEKVRMEMEERRKRQARKILEAIEIGMAKRLRAKEEEIEKIGKLNWALEEKVKSLCIENQIWRDLAQTNEATANALRTNLEQVLQAAQVNKDRGCAGLENDDDAEDCVGGAGVLGGDDLADDAQSCCGENDDVGGWRPVVRPNDDVKEETMSNVSGSGGGNRMCRNCGKEESCVLLLPCRHLCLCTVCGSSLHTCPICKSTKNASVHVNMS